MRISDRITVIKHGETVRTVDTKDTNPQKIAEMMVGREVLLRVEKPEAKIGQAVLKVENLCIEKNRDVLALDNVSFEIKEGEILGIAGVEGNGQTELIEAIMGLNLDKIKKGKVFLGNDDVSALTTKERLDKGFSHVPEDRHKRGLVLDYSIRDNLILGQQDNFTANGFLENAKMDSHADKLIAEFDIRPPHKEVLSGGMSGGNQQKIIIAREFFRKFKFLISAQPTRGVDIGAIEFIHKQIIKARTDNKAILLVSAELSEILSLSDKVAVLYKGKIVKILEADKTNENELGMLMTGASNG